MDKRLYQSVRMQELTIRPHMTSLSTSSMGESKSYKTGFFNRSGPSDRLMPSQLRAVPVNTPVRVFNLIMWCKRLLKHLLDSRTIFIPKKPGAIDPVDFRGHGLSRYPRHWPDYLTVFLLKGLIAPWSSARSRRPSEQASMVLWRNTDLIDSILRRRYEMSKSTYIATLGMEI